MFFLKKSIQWQSLNKLFVERLKARQNVLEKTDEMDSEESEKHYLLQLF